MGVDERVARFPGRNARCVMMKSWVMLIAVGMSFGHAADLHAQALKKYRTPEGKIIYSDKPVPGATEVGEIAPPPPVDPAKRAEAEKAARKDSEAAKAVDAQLKARDAQRERVAAAEAKLEKAERALKEGVEPRAGERTGIAGGGSRLNDAYHARQKANQQAVDEARAELEAARAGK